MQSIRSLLRLFFTWDMNKIEFSFERKKIEELTHRQKEVIETAKNACDKSYSPYSHFSVGAVVEMENGEILSASNQENASYPSGLCAERNVLFYAKAQYPDKEVIRIAIVAKNEGVVTKTPVSPCGSCRQVMTETAMRQKRKIELIMAGEDTCIIVHDVNDLLPLQFNADSMR